MSIPFRPLRPGYAKLLYGMLLQRLRADWLRRREDWANMESRRIELVCGVLAGALGLTALGALLFAPLVSEPTDCGFANPPPPGPCPIVYTSAVQLQGLANLWLPMALYGGLSLSIVLFAMWHSLARSLPALVLLWVCTVLFWLATLALLHNLLSVFFFPADVLALGASIAGTVAAQQRVPAPG